MLRPVSGEGERADADYLSAIMVFAGKCGRLGRGDKISSPRMLKRKAGELLLR